MYEDVSTIIGVSCQAGSYSASAGASACSQCPLGAKPDPKLADCLCPVGTFSLPIPNTSQITCNGCPAGAVCTMPGVTLAGLITAPGWWRAPNTLRFYPCRFPELCLGGLGNVCEFAREGALCSVCVASYSSNGAGFREDQTHNYTQHTTHHKRSPNVPTNVLVFRKALHSVPPAKCCVG